MLWVLLTVMGLVACLFAIAPFLGRSARSLPAAVLTTLAVLGIAVALYAWQGEPGVPSGASEQPDVAGMVTSLAARLESQPDDVNGWKMLGRSYMTLGEFPAAVDAYRRAVELEEAQDAQTLVNYGVALARAGGEDLSPQAIAVFENAVALAPNDPEALFWGGIAAVNRNDRNAAAERWERLLATDPPEEVRAILTERIALWRGEPAAATTTDAAETAPASLAIAVRISADAAASLPGDATVFVIARDPAQPSPPVAVARRTVAELPLTVELSDRDAMIPGRSLSNFDRLEIVVRASASGNPIAAPGDWFGSAELSRDDSASVAIEIAQEVASEGTSEPAADVSRN